VVIGGGLLGLEAANGLAMRGMDVTVIHLADWLLERQLDQTAGRMLQKSLEDRGLKFLLGRQTEMLIAGESGRVAALRLKDGAQIAADLVVMAAASARTRTLAEAAGIYCNRGIVVNDTLQTYDPASTPSASASRIAASPTVSSRRSSSRARSARTTWPTSASAATSARWSRPSSR
jgi:nitrite reductase (NADH) large subunit